MRQRRVPDPLSKERHSIRNTSVMVMCRQESALTVAGTHDEVLYGFAVQMCTLATQCSNIGNLRNGFAVLAPQASAR